MATEIGGYREYNTATVTTTTHNLDLPEIRDRHKVYLTIVGMRCDKANSDVEIFIVSGGQEFLIRHTLNLTQNEGHTQMVRTWLYQSEFIRFKFGGIVSGDVVEGWAVGEDKWEVTIGQGD